nr:Unknown Function [uncultured bacterium]
MSTVTLSNPGDRTARVSAGEMRVFNPGEASSILTTSINRCTGFVMRNAAGVYVFSHLEPFFDKGPSQIDMLVRQGEWQPESAQATLFYGSHSMPQAVLEAAIKGGRWGDIELHRVGQDTGEHPFDMQLLPEEHIVAITSPTMEPSVAYHELAI